jgi:site-specific DNA-methyltransferase (adenine-specific)
MIIHVLRKPVMGTVAQNALQHGCGALNIDGCRVRYEEGGTIASNPLLRKESGAKIRYGLDKSPTSFALETKEGEMQINNAGRWPANLVFSHHPTCVAVGQKKVKGSNFQGHPNGRVNAVYGVDNRGRPAAGYADADGKETITAYKCHNNCPVAALDEQSGDLSSQVTRTNPSRNTGIPCGYTVDFMSRKGARKEYLNEVGGASRFFKQFGGGEEP